MTGHLLLIDDDPITERQLLPVLARELYQVACVKPGPDALRHIVIHEPDLLILGIDCRKGDWTFCNRLLAFVDKPLLLLLSTGNKLDRTRALELGADDCMIKPVIIPEVLARIRLLLQRQDSAARSERSYFVDGKLLIDLERREVQRDGRFVALTPTEFRVLSSLVKHAGHVVPHDRLIMQVWGPDYAGADRALKVYVHQLRKKLERDPRRPQRILTRRGEGYLFQRLSNT